MRDMSSQRTRLLSITLLNWLEQISSLAVKLLGPAENPQQLCVCFPLHICCRHATRIIVGWYLRTDGL